MDWDIFRPVYKKCIVKNGIQWVHKFCSSTLPTGKRVQQQDHYHETRCASCWHTVEDDNHIFTCVKRKAHQRSIIEQIKTLRSVVHHNLCDILQEGIMAYFLGECMTNNTMLRIRGQEAMERYALLIDRLGQSTN